MNSKSHLYASLAKSFIRVIGCVLAIVGKSVFLLAVLFLLAEVLGIVEELIDERG